jgi:hypothetical protein
LPQPLSSVYPSVALTTNKLFRFGVLAALLVVFAALLLVCQQPFFCLPSGLCCLSGFSRHVLLHSYEIELLPSVKLHPVFHIWLLKPVVDNPFPEQTNPPLPVVVENDEEWIVKEVLDSKLWDPWKKLRYLVKWQGYDDCSWEPAEEINGLKQIDHFHTKYPDKPGPLPED